MLSLPAPGQKEFCAGCFYIYIVLHRMGPKSLHQFGLRKDNGGTLKTQGYKGKEV